MMVSVNILDINWKLLFGYITSEIIIYITALLVAKYIFKLLWREAIIIGMAASFANHLLFVYPIVFNEYNDDLIIPILEIIGFDCIFLVINIIFLDLITTKNLSIKKIFLKQLNNIPLIALTIGILISYLEIEIPPLIDRSINFISASVAPCALFAVGIILAQKTEKTQIQLSKLIILFKIILHPILSIFIIWKILDIDFSISETSIMVAYAPVGLMALIFSTQYGVKPYAITRAYCLQQ
jgi:malonate transporter